MALRHSESNKTKIVFMRASNNAVPAHSMPQASHPVKSVMADIDERYDAALTVARDAAALAHRYFIERDSLAVEAKGSQDYVSLADRAVEDLIRGEVARRFPADAFLGEESARGFAGDERGGVWIVDPIDGTHNFLRGARYYCVSIAYAENGRREIGIVCDPEHDEIFHARRGGGAWLSRGVERIRLAVSECHDLARAFVCLGHHDRFASPHYLEVRRAFMEHGVAMRNMGAGALQLAHVAAGRYDGFVELSLNAWDAMAGLLLVEEAGGFTAPFPGPQGITRPAPVLACAKGIAEPLKALVKAW
jgi:myo-inositol-1(or 4)-monophosphatase